MSNETDQLQQLLDDVIEGKETVKDAMRQVIGMMIYMLKLIEEGKTK